MSIKYILRKNGNVNFLKMGKKFVQTLIMRDSN